MRRKPAQIAATSSSECTPGFDTQRRNHYGCRAPSSERGLQQVQADEHGQQQPPRRHEMGQHHAEQEHDTGKRHPHEIDVHGTLLLYFGSTTTAPQDLTRSMPSARKSVGSGKSVSVRVNFGGLSNIQNNHKQ